MYQKTSKKIVLTKWSFGLAALCLALLALIASPDLKSLLSSRDSNLKGAIGSYLQQINIEATKEKNIFTTTSGVELKKGFAGYEKSRRIESDPVLATNDFIGVGFRWHEFKPAGTTLGLSYRVGNDLAWSSWREVLASDDVRIKDDPEAIASDLQFVTSSTKIQVAINLGTSNLNVTPRLTDLRMDFINSLSGPSASTAVNSASAVRADATTVGSPNIISRAGWGANESWMTWTPQYANVQQIIVHHTAGSDGGNDSAAVVRGIYYYHANTLGWGDIGYNYLIDAQGRIYRGRAGGDKVIGGHAYGYNSGSIGIALLGTYDTKAATPAAEAALADLAGYLSAKFNLEPNQAHNFIDKNAYMLSGHRDFNSTLCPGTTEHSRLPAIRVSASTAKGNYLSGNYGAQLAKISGNVILKNHNGTATVQIKNTGKATWYAQGNSSVLLKTYGPLDHASALYAKGWRTRSQPALMSPARVAPGQLATFRVSLASAKPSNTSDNFSLTRGKTVIPGSVFTLTRSSREPYSGQVVGLPSTINTEGGVRKSIDIKIKNTGFYAWKNSGKNFAALNLTSPIGRTSNLRTADWPASYRPTIMDSANVAPDQTALFRFNLKIPAKVGDYYEPMQPVIEKVMFIPGAGFKLHLRVSNQFQAKITERPLQIFGAPNQVVPASVTVTNRSKVVWSPSGASAVTLTGLGSGASALKTSQWLSANTVTALSKQIKPGQSTVLNFNVKLPQTYGTIEQLFQLQSGKQKIDGTKFKLRLVTRRDYEAKVLSATPKITLKAGTKGRAAIRIQNKGSKTWYAKKSPVVSVVTNRSWKHASSFKTASWNNAYSPTNMEPAVVGPDQVATLSIEIAAGTKNGKATEYFGLAEPDSTPIVYSGFGITRQVSGAGGVAGNSVIRAGIYSTGGNISVLGHGPYRVQDLSGKVFGSPSSGTTAVTWTGSAYKISGAVNGSSGKSVLFVPLSNTILELPGFSNHPAWNPALNDNAFRGNIEIRHNSDNKLYAINHVKLEYYLRGIAEASNNDYPEYLRALMIAVRTYAEYHRQNGGKHASLGYDLSNTDQVYRGYNFEKRAGSIVAAVMATTGQFVTYHGKIVVTPYFSQSDGHTRSFSQVFGGPNKPWLVSVSVPEDNGKPLLGHGVGMSARAARLRAAAGKNAASILKSFYTGISIVDLY